MTMEYFNEPLFDVLCQEFPAYPKSDFDEQPLPEKWIE